MHYFTHPAPSADASPHNWISTPPPPRRTNASMENPLMLGGNLLERNYLEVIECYIVHIKARSSKPFGAKKLRRGPLLRH